MAKNIVEAIVKELRVPLLSYKVDKDITKCTLYHLFFKNKSSENENNSIS